MTFSKQIPATITTSNIRIPDTPDFSFTNPLKKNMFVNGVEIVCTPEFSRKGVVIIAVDNNILFDSRDTKAFSNVAFMPVNLNAVFERDRIITVSAFNQVDTNEIEVTINVFIDEVERTLNSALQYFSQDVVNAIVSEDEILFPVRDYVNEVVTKLLDMKGYTKMILSMSAANYPSPTVDSSDGLGSASLVVDGDLDTFNSFGSGAQSSGGGSAVIDFGTNIERLPRMKFGITVSISGGLGTSEGTITMSVSEDNQTFNEIGTVTIDAPPSTSNDPTTFSGVSQFFRYMKVVWAWEKTVNLSNPANAKIYEMYDGNQLGGTASLSFEQQDPASLDFDTFIPASEFGTVTTGEAVKVQVGDVSNIAQSGVTYILPSTQTGFRAKLTITSGGINTGVGITKVI